MDRESVITHLQIIHTWAEFACERGMCFSDTHLENIAQWAKDAVDLLKEQETKDTGKRRIFECEKCGYGIDDIFLSDEVKHQIEPKYCPNCGRVVR